MKHPSQLNRILLLCTAMILLAVTASMANTHSNTALDKPVYIFTPPNPGAYSEVTGLNQSQYEQKSLTLSNSASWQSFAGEAGSDWFVQWNTAMGTPHLATGQALALPGVSKLTSTNIESACKSFISTHFDILKIKSSQLLLADAAQAGGCWYAAFQQVYKSVPVFGGRLTMSFTKDDRLIMFGSDIYPEVTAETTPKISSKQAAKTAQADCQYISSNDTLSDIELIILPVPDGSTTKYALCWKMDIMQPSVPAKWQYFVNAVTGKIIGKWNILRYNNITGTVQQEHVPEFPNDLTRITTPCPYAKVTARGPEQIIQFWNMDTNPGFTFEGLWAYGTPTGGGSHQYHNYIDPTSGYTGSKVIGYNLSGDYPDNMGSTMYAKSPVIDCSGHQNVWLKFYRWLGVEDSTWDHANIQVSGNGGASWTTIWNHYGSTISDSSWQLMEYDISAVAANSPTVQIRWGLGPSDSIVTYCGWNIDDVTIFTGRPSAYTLSDGTYSVLCPWDPSTLVSKFEGRYCNVTSQGSPESEFRNNNVHPDDIINWTWNSSLYRNLDESNVYWHINYAHDWYKTLDPTFTALDYPLPAICSASNYYTSYWDGNSIILGRGNNDYYGNRGLASEVIYHEYTHAVSSKIYGGSLNNVNSFSYQSVLEGLSDYYGCVLSLSQSPKVEDGGVYKYFPDGIRNLDNHYRLEIDLSDDYTTSSQIFSGALWDARNAIGAEVMDKLVHFARYARPTSPEDFLTAILVEDDKHYGDNNIVNGTPHSQAIFKAFGDHGIGGLYMIADSQVIDDENGNKNGKLEPGETIKLSVTLINQWSNASNVKATLVSNDPYVSITKSQADFPQLGLGGIANNSNDPYIVTVLPDCPETHTINFDLQITADGNYSYTRSSLFYKTVAVKQIAYDDGSADSNKFISSYEIYAMRMTPDSYPCYLTRVRLYPTNLFGASKTVTVKLWDDNGANDTPGTELGSIDVELTTVNSWVDVDISSLRIAVEDGNVYVGIVPHENEYIYWGVDTDLPDMQRCMYKYIYNNYWYSEPFNLMIRLRYSAKPTLSMLKKDIGDGDNVLWPSAVVTAAFPDFFYIEADDRSCGIRVEQKENTVYAGARVSVAGTMKTSSNGERCVSANEVIQIDTGSIQPVLVSNKNIGGAEFGMQEGTWSWRWISHLHLLLPCGGLNNTGLLVKTSGIVTSWGRGWFYIDDGSRVEDGTGNLGVYVSAPEMIIPAMGTYVSVTGISSCDYYDGKLMNVLLPRSQEDIEVLKEPYISTLGAMSIITGGPSPRQNKNVINGGDSHD